MLTILYDTRLAFANRQNKSERAERKIMMPLIYAEKEQPQIIRKIGGSPEVKKHLEDLGFNVGGEVSIVSMLGENVIVKVKESRVAVSDELAKKIMV